MKKKEKGIDIFLTYANNSLTEDPQNFEKILNLIEECFPVKFIDRNINRLFFNVLKSKDKLLSCQFRPSMTALIGEELCDDPKCWKCCQSFFIAILWQIVAGVRYNEIMGFKVCINIYSKISPMGLVSLERQEPYNLIKTTWWGENLSGLLVSGINNCLVSAATYCLLDFLTQDERNREKLKICHNCGLFFVKKRHRDDQLFCSETCRKYYNNHKPGAQEKVNKKKKIERDKGNQKYY